MKKVTENTKVTLTLKQLKRLVKESSYDYDKVEREQIELLDQLVDRRIFEDEYEASDWRNGLEIALRNSMKENLPRKMRSMSDDDLDTLAFVMINIFARELLAARGNKKG